MSVILLNPLLPLRGTLREAVSVQLQWLNACSNAYGNGVR